MTKPLQKILLVSSTLPASSDDPVPAFVSDQVKALKQLHPELQLHILAPHNAYTKTHAKVEHDDYTEYRFHYFWPHRLELLAGRGIGPALKAHKWLYLAVPFLFLCESMAIRRLAKRLKPDLLYVHWFMPQAVAAAPVARSLRLPLVFTTHASDVAVLKIVPGAKRLVQAICRQTIAFSAVSEQTADRLRYFWPAHGSDREALEAKLSIIPMGTDLPKVATHKTDIYPGKTVITFIGRLVERKGVTDLIEAFKAVHQEHSETLLVVAGDGQDRHHFQELAAELGEAVIFPGYVTGQIKNDLLARTDILCLPSVNDGVHAEGLPVVFMEGLAAGTIIIASDVTGAQEHLTDGRDGYLFAQGDIAALTNSLRRATELTPQQTHNMQTAARQLATNFSWPEVAARQYTVLQDAYDTFHAPRA